MSEGVRIQHPTERDCTFTLTDARRPYAQPVACAPCGTVHVFKTYHFGLDTTGAAIVSQEIAERLRSLPGMGGFRVANAVTSPPPQQLIVGAPLVRGAPLVPHPSLTEAG
ncbi:hypothetical protein BH23CHL8_BH23CHL8_30470 [soil metagenome]